VRNWHLLMTKPREDERAEEHLRNQHYEIFRPMVKQYQLKRGKQVAVTESLFPRYIFIELDEEFSHWASLRSTRGVAGLVRFNELPAIVPQELVHELRALVDEDGVLDKTGAEPFIYKSGDRVQISTTSLKGLDAIVHAQLSAERVAILLNMFGKVQTLELPLAHLRPAKT
jgi:transcriptional antiterminator RfaH